MVVGEVEKREEEGHNVFLNEHLPDTGFTCAHPPHLPGENGTEIGVAILCLPEQFVHRHMESLAYSNVFR